MTLGLDDSGCLTDAPWLGTGVPHRDLGPLGLFASSLDVTHSVVHAGAVDTCVL